MTDGNDEEARGRLWLAETLWKLGGLQFGDFSLGRTVRNSPVYLNAKLLISRPDALKRTLSLIADELELGMTRRNRTIQPFDGIAGVPIGGLYLATGLALRMDRPLLYVRPPREADAVAAPYIEGIYRPGERILVVDDLASGGGSLIETIVALQNAGLMVSDAVVLVDREQGAARRLEGMGVRLHAILSLEVTLRYLESSGHIATDDFDRAMAYLRREGEPRSEFD